MKKSAVFILAAVLILTMCACGEKNKNAPSYNYEESDGGIVLTRYLGSETAIAIPTVYDGKAVLAIGSSAFDGTSVKDISVPFGITLSNGAFASCTSLETVTLEKGITFIPDECFKNCPSLRELNAPSVAECGNDAFSFDAPLISECGGEYAVIGDGLLIARLGTGAFASVPDGVKNIGSAFSEDTYLSSVYLPDSVTYIPDGAFKNCTSLLDVMLPTTLTSIGQNAFYGCASVERIEIPASCTSLGDFAFSGCSSLYEIIIPDSVKDFGKNVFADDDKIKITTPFESTAFSYAVENNIPLS